jgi:hypothetical protein
LSMQMMVHRPYIFYYSYLPYLMLDP